MVAVSKGLTHKIRAMSTKTKEDDNLYAIYGPRVPQTPYSLRQWLHTFLLSCQGFFEERGEFYLQTKVMSFETWREAVIDGRKGNVLTLFALNILMDLHTYVHLLAGCCWTTLKNVPESHEDIVKCCDIHLLYLGWDCSWNSWRGKTHLK